MIYKKYVGPTITQVLEEQLSRPRSEQLEMYDELALLRGLTMRVVQTWSALIEADKNPEALAMSELVKDNIAEISRLVNTISTIESRTNDEVNVHTLNGLVAQMTSMLYSVCGVENEELARVFAERMRNELVIPAIESKGTTITPDQMVQEMDNTIPLVGEDDE